ncbi:MAG: hypothetical protein B6A08_17910 [Sorangiineae bacterium NIC37A_2]|jgi:hypothetical protein|nr:MAG: hypothetical protein B6A08_17910 [Sorangiineae bacterium NIC37A_2]
MKRLFDSFGIRLITLGSAAFLALHCDMTFQACEDCTVSGGSGGRAHGAGGGHATGGLGGDAGDAGLAGASGSGEGGEQGGPEAPSPPVLERVRVGELELGPGELVLGVVDAPELVFSFSQPMDKKSVEAAYSSDNRGTRESRVAFSWNAQSDELRIIPLLPLEHEEVDDPDAETETYSIRLAKSAKSRDGLELEETFEASFRLMKRVTFMVIPDLEASYWRTAPAEKMIRDDGLYPDHQWFYCPFFPFPDRPEEAGPLLLGYEPLVEGYVAYQAYLHLDISSPEKNSYGVYVFPLPSNVEFLESASLRVVKWIGNVGSPDESPLRRSGLAVDLLAPDFEDPASDEPVLSDLVNVSGNNSSYGFGPTEFDVTAITTRGLDAGDERSVYRLGLDSAPDDLYYTGGCAAAALTLVYWAL